MKDFKSLRQINLDNQKDLNDRQIFVLLATKKSKQMRFLRDVISNLIVALVISLIIFGSIPEFTIGAGDNLLYNLVKGQYYFIPLLVAIGYSTPLIIHLFSKGKIQITPQEIKKAVSAGIEFDYVHAEQAKEMIDHIDENCK